jgi:hypothetical protein
LKEQSRLKDKATGVDKDVRAPTKKTQYFLTMDGEIKSSKMHINDLNSKWHRRSWEASACAVSSRF